MCDRWPFQVVCVCPTFIYIRLSLAVCVCVCGRQHSTRGLHIDEGLSDQFGGIGRLLPHLSPQGCYGDKCVMDSGLRWEGPGEKEGGRGEGVWGDDKQPATHYNRHSRPYTMP